MASVGLPGLNGFVGEFLILLGAFQNNPWAAIISTTAVILAAGYMLWLVRRMFFGPVTKPENETIKDLDRRELAILVPLIILIIWIGVYPRPFLSRIEPDLKAWVEKVQGPQLSQDAPVTPVVPVSATSEAVR